MKESKHVKQRFDIEVFTTRQTVYLNTSWIFDLHDYKPNAENLFNVNEFQKGKDPNSENKPVQPTEIKKQN